ncbi:MAG: chemotaxis response regulator protein-glutamate methylesterase [Kofleriaceae bacterium]
MTKVLIVDDSALMRKMLTEILSTDPTLQVVGAAPDPLVARDMIKQLNPDVLTLDVEMPSMDGLTFLRNLMRLRPMPVVMVSSLTERGADATLSALELGAIDFVAKPKLDVKKGMADLGSEIIGKVKVAARAKPQALGERQVNIPQKQQLLTTTTDRLIAIGASTGGTEAIARVLSMMPASSPGVVITQHIPAAFSGRFAERLNGCSALTVKEAKEGDPILIGHAYVAPGSHHLRVVRKGARYICTLGDDAPINRHRPSVDALMWSVAESAGQNAVGVMLTGMGADGAEGMLAMKERGAPTIAQDEATSVVWGMPGAAVKRGGVSDVVPLDGVAARVAQFAR